jgi:hydroxypyruvate reductase
MTDPAAFLTQNFLAAVKAVTPAFVLPQHMPDFPARGRVIVLALGKAAEEMVRVALASLRQKPGFDEKRFAALAVIRTGDKLPGNDALITVMEAAHPRPDESSAQAARALLALAGTATADDLVLCLISGGGSSLTMCPAEGLQLSHLQAANDALLKGGVPIDKMNTLRKHLSSFSGGRLRLAAQGRVMTFAISDVPGDDLCVIASGPTVADGSSFADALNVVRDFNLTLPPEALTHLQKGAAGAIGETLKSDDPRIAHDVVRVIASSSVAVAAGEKHGRENGFTVINQGIVEGEAHEAAEKMAAEILAFARTCTQPTLFVSGGELTVTLPRGAAPGTGGRNSRFALKFLQQTKGAKGIHALACGTDGIDYTTYAGAVMTDASWAAAEKAGLSAEDYLSRFDSHAFFEKTGGLVKTDATHTNVGDYRAILVLP